MNTESNQPTSANVSGGKAAYEERKQEKMRAKVVEGGPKNPSAIGRKLGWIGGSILVLALVGYGIFIFVRNSVPQENDRSTAIPILPASHIQVGAEHEAYNSNPPTSGPHYEVPAKPGFREEPIADEHLVHSLEHGLIWISYNPRVGEAVKEKLRTLLTPWTVITAREANDTDIAVAAWGRLDAFNLDDGSSLSEVDEARIKDFIKRYANRGPEKIPPGQHGGI